MDCCYIWLMSLVVFAASSAPSSTAPAWVATFGTISQIITAIGVIIAGTFAFFKFSKGRTFHPRCSICIEPELMEIEGFRALKVFVTIRNDGLVALLYPKIKVPQRLFVGQADRTTWQQSCERGWPVVWQDNKKSQYSLAVADGNSLEPSPTKKQKQTEPWWRWLSRRWLLQQLRGDIFEPGEQLVRSIVVPISSEGLVYLLRVRVSTCRHVGVRHVLWHRLRCCKRKSTGTTWSRDVYVFPRSISNVNTSRSTTWRVRRVGRNRSLS